MNDTRMPDDWFSQDQSYRDVPTEAILDSLRVGTPESNPILVQWPSEWASKEIPRRNWVVDGWIPVGSVTLFSGDGGLGKSLLSQQLLTSATFGLPFLDIPVRGTFKSLGLFCEDDTDELMRRQYDICRHLGLNMKDLDRNLAIQSRVGLDNIIMTFGFKDDTGRMTSLWESLTAFVQWHGIRLLVLDTAADMFGGNENIRAHVRGFIGRLRGLAKDMNGAVVLTAHPSVAGMASGTGFSGSTAWNNSVRSRLYLERSKTERDVRTIKNMKSNYSPLGNQVSIRYHDGVFVVDDPLRFVPEQEEDNPP